MSQPGDIRIDLNTFLIISKESQICYIPHSDTCHSTPVVNSPVIYEDNASYVTQVKGGYIKSDKIKHI